jgi:hypothetical protein
MADNPYAQYQTEQPDSKDANPYEGYFQDSRPAGQSPIPQATGSLQGAAPTLKPYGMQEGEDKNEIGNTVIVPKNPGTFLRPYGQESFSDTMRRAAAQGRKTTPEQLQEEERTIPAKAATVVAAAPVIGAAGVPALDVLGSTATGAYNAAKSIPDVASKVVKTIKNIPSAAMEEFKTRPISTLYKVGMGFGFLDWLRRQEGK